MRATVSLLIFVFSNATIAHAESVLDEMKICYQRISKMEIEESMLAGKERGKAKNACVETALSSCQAAEMSRFCFQSIERNAGIESKLLSADLRKTFRDVIASNSVVSMRLSRIEDVIGQSVCDDGGARCGAMSSLWVYASLLDISEKFRVISEDIK